MARLAPAKPRAPKRAAPKKPHKSADPLARYHAKRDFSRTQEPRGTASQKSAGTFVVQKHAATRLHYDFRLEIDGVLKSWAVPKGIPTTEGERHLAVMVEDHPLDYGGFEGTIPKGQYGGGAVMLWDRGTFRVGGDDPAKALREGKLHLYLDGEKLRGEWALVRMHGEENQWLLLKAGEPIRPTARTWERSVLTKRTIEEIADTVVMPEFIEPMKAKPATQPPKGIGWLMELKYDGYRFLGAKAGREVKLWSRAANDLTARFPSVAKALAGLKADSALIDGELVVPDVQGRPSFQLIQNATEKTPVSAFVFDLLQLDGRDVRGEPLESRRAQLAALLPPRSTVLHFSMELSGEPESVLRQIAENGLEGIVAKRRDSAYEAGRRSGAWVKIRCLREQEFVIGGFTAPGGSRSRFGALLVGYYRGKELVYAGKVGTGFNEKTLRELHERMLAHRIEKPPFSHLPTRRTRWGTAFTRAELARCTWIEPVLVAQIRFAEWTGDGVLRQPSYLGLREHKPAREVVRET